MSQQHFVPRRPSSNAGQISWVGAFLIAGALMFVALVAFICLRDRAFWVVVG